MGRRSRAFRKLGRGQAMLEYSLITWILAAALLVTTTLPVFDPFDPSSVPLRRSLIELFLDAYQTYYDSFYFVLNMPFP